MLTLIRPLAFLLFAAPSQAPAPQTPAVKPPAPSATTTFHSDILHLDYTYDSALIAAPDVSASSLQGVRNETSGKARQAVDCISMPLTAVNTTNGIRMLLIMRFDSACLASMKLSSNPTKAVTSSFAGSLGRFGDPEVVQAEDYTVAGRSASATSGSVVSAKYGTTVYGAATCLMQGADIVCWEFISNDCSALPALMSAPVKFEDQPAEPLIPNRFAPTCK